MQRPTASDVGGLAKQYQQLARERVGRRTKAQEAEGVWIDERDRIIVLRKRGCPWWDPACRPQLATQPPPDGGGQYEDNPLPDTLPLGPEQLEARWFIRGNKKFKAPAEEGRHRQWHATKKNGSTVLVNTRLKQSKRKYGQIGRSIVLVHVRRRQTDSAMR